LVDALEYLNSHVKVEGLFRKSGSVGRQKVLRVSEIHIITLQLNKCLFLILLEWNIAYSLFWFSGNIYLKSNHFLKTSGQNFDEKRLM